MGATIIEPHPALLGPFAILLLSIAIFPLILRQHWERHYQKFCALLAATTSGYYVFALQGLARVQHAAVEYASFIVVVGAFFVVAGAIHLHIPRPASPLSNVMFLFSGSILANFIGTIGASMLLLRPFLHMNRGRGSGMHVAFFIFIVGNLGGALLPVGPPLFLGYIKGVPFLWAALHCWPQWLTATVALLVIFFVADTIARSRGPRRGNARHSLSLLRKMEFRRTSRAPARSRFCSQRRARTVDDHRRGGFIFSHSATRLRGE